MKRDAEDIPLFYHASLEEGEANLTNQYWHGSHSNYKNEQLFVIT